MTTPQPTAPPHLRPAGTTTRWRCYTRRGRGGASWTPLPSRARCSRCQISPCGTGDIFWVRWLGVGLIQVQQDAGAWGGAGKVLPVAARLLPLAPDLFFLDPAPALLTYLDAAVVYRELNMHLLNMICHPLA